MQIQNRGFRHVAKRVYRVRSLDCLSLWREIASALHSRASATLFRPALTLFFQRPYTPGLARVARAAPLSRNDPE